MTKGHNFVIKNRTIEIPKSHAHLQIMMKHSAQFQVNLIQDVAGVTGTRSKSARAVTPLKMAETKIKKPHAHLHIVRIQSVKFQINPMKDVGGVAGTRFRKV